MNSAAVADDLLNKGSLIYSDRPFPMTAGKLMQREKSMFHMCVSGIRPTTCKGFYIPTKATITANIWAMMHDAEQYPDP
ncbi:hypothetical protein CVT26_000201 [Gymnopilus dilepis]|uniref:Uncharacterized protein n=1 Tax=Gymnopilus dilepis TaxID=231916 RepID=A0A409VG43_9AGAR|nr:hypothetical protein CVT26_000201 [Gymnopilus dilepis]